MNVVQNTENFGRQSQKSSVVDFLCREIQSSPNNKRTYNNSERQPKKKRPCHYCGLNGHWKSECRKRQRDQNALSQKQTNQSRNDNQNFKRPVADTTGQVPARITPQINPQMTPNVPHCPPIRNQMHCLSMPQF